jgi:hypothetical protein
MRFSRSGWNLAEWLERLAVNDKVATVLGLIPAFSDTVESGGRQMKQCWITYLKRKKIQKNKTKKFCVAVKYILYRNLMTCFRPTMELHRKPVAHSNLWKNNSTLRRHHTAVFCSTLFSSSPSLTINNAAIHFHQHFRYGTKQYR